MKQQIIQYLGISTISGVIGLSLGASIAVLGSAPIIALGVGSIGYGAYLQIQGNKNDEG